MLQMGQQRNSKQRRADRERALLVQLRAVTCPSMVASTGSLTTSQSRLDGSAHRPPHGTYARAAVRPTIIVGKKKSGPVSVVHLADLPSVPVMPATQVVVSPTPKPLKKQGKRLVPSGRKIFSIDGFTPRIITAVIGDE